jgi:hypothetical protein
MTLQEHGTVRAEGDRLQFAPASTVVERTDPIDPDGDYRRTATRPTWHRQWTVNGNTLILSDNGEDTTYQRE